MRYDKSEIRKGVFLELDCSIRTPFRAPQYGDDPPDFSAISDRLDVARKRLEQMWQDFNARRQ